MSVAAAKDVGRQLLGTLLDHVTTLAELRASAEELRAGEVVTWERVGGGSLGLVLTAVRRLLRQPLLVLVPSSETLDRLEEELPLFSNDSWQFFPPWQVDVSRRTPAEPVFGQRLRSLRALLDEGTTPALLADMAAVMQSVPPPAAVRQRGLTLQVDAVLDQDTLRRWLIEHGYQSVSAVEKPGEFCCRGGVWDIFAADAELPVRLEWFGDCVESLRLFDPASQRSVQTVSDYALVSAQSQVCTATDDDNTACSTSTACSPSTNPSYLTDYLPPNTVVVVVEPQSVQQEAEAFFHRRSEHERLCSIERLWSELVRFPQLHLAALAPGAGGLSIRLPFEGVERFSGEVGRVAEEFDQAVGSDQVILVVQTQAEQQRLSELLAATRVYAEQRLAFVVGTLYQGFRCFSAQTLVLSGADLFRRTTLVRRGTRVGAAQPIDAFLQLEEGDLVVHLAHGIGRFRGVELLDHNGRQEEHLVIEFADAVKVYVPSSRIELVQKYVGGTRRPTLARIGSKTWLRQKQAAQRAVMDIAVEMLELQARRLAHPGHACGPDSLWQHEFDAAFPYQETPDQLAALAQIKQDMESPRPMDRLLCGDVGFGKTELAMRAAFKAVDNGFQVALMAPTTVLVEQHYRTFTERMAEFPLTIARLSRFCSAAEQRRVLQGLADGRIDIVIGTHRLASRDVRFRNLGLVIIDEEQRFGVQIKEHLKNLRSSVDVLTLSATPIPRTLHMALVGVRDICTLETPPADRQAVETRVIRWDNDLIREAVLRELARHGQIYFVHNRVEDIHQVAKRLRMIVPEARMAIGHAQLAEDELEKVMLDFIDHRVDLLLATTIVENGLDIPNANTIFIDEADRYGLADLHQLRGRVGRYKHKAYCYLLLDPRKPLTPNAARRLLAIEEFSHIGAGFGIAMRDLEIRGAGNLLGTEQSGHIAAIGYELYCQLLENAVRALKQLPPKSVWDVDIRLPLAAYLPEQYVNDIRFRIDIYRRMNRLETEEELRALAEELRDRFGPWPEPVEGLFTMVRLRQWASHWRLTALFLEEEFLVMRYADRTLAQRLAKRASVRPRFVGDEQLYFPLDGQVTAAQGIVQFVQSVLRP